MYWWLIQGRTCLHPLCPLPTTPRGTKRLRRRDSDPKLLSRHKVRIQTLLWKSKEERFYWSSMRCAANESPRLLQATIIIAAFLTSCCCAVRLDKWRSLFVHGSRCGLGGGGGVQLSLIHTEATAAAWPRPTISSLSFSQRWKHSTSHKTSKEKVTSIFVLCCF